MAAAALVLLAAGVGVGYGWQPMPDGSQRYEYLVQVEPELLATLEEGRSVPIVSEVPEDIRPIGRIRITVGRGDLPRQRIVTDLKPAGDAASASSAGGVELAQYTQSAAPRYVQAPTGDPRYGAPAAAADDAVDSWNGGDAPAAAAPATAWPAGAGASPANSLRVANGATAPDAGGNTWNDGAAAPANAGPFGRVGDGIDRVTQPIRNGLQQAAQPIRNGIERVDDRMRDAAGNLGDKTRKLADELTGRTTLPGVSAGPATPAPDLATAPPWNGATQAQRRQPAGATTSPSIPGTSSRRRVRRPATSGAWSNGPRRTTASRPHRLPRPAASTGRRPPLRPPRSHRSGSTRRSIRATLAGGTTGSRRRLRLPPAARPDSLAPLGVTRTAANSRRRR